MKTLQNMRKWSVLPLALLLVGCGGKAYRKTADGIIVTVQEAGEGGPQKVRLQVINENIIRVTESGDSKFHDQESLVVLPQKRTAEFTVEEEGCGIVLKTSAVSAKVCTKKGKVSFTDADGNPITAEKQPSQFTPIQADATQGFTVINRFTTTEDEGIYGLGQHQSDEWNMKGLNEDLYQYNTKISIPFVISTRNYGILWDTYAHSRYGNPEEFKQLNRVFKLYDKDGKEGSLTGTYEAMSFGRWGMRPGAPAAKPEPLVRAEDSIFYANSEQIKLLPRLGSNVAYEGWLEAPETGKYQFLLYYAGYVTVYINDEEVVPERWRTSWNPNSWKFFYDMEAGQKYRLKVAWKPDGGTSYIGLRAYAPADPETQQDITMWTEMVKQSDYYLIAGDSMDGVISGLRTLVGKANVMPKWSMGFWQSRERYRTQDDLVSTLKEFRDRHIGIDNIVQDWNYWEDDAWGSHEFEASRYPDPQKMLDDVHGMNAHFMISVWPKFYMTTDHYKEFDAKGWMFTRAVEDSIRDWVGPGYIGSFYDAYSEGARKLFWSQMKEHLYKYGIDAWWMDASEPNVRDCVPLDYQKQLTGPTALGSSTEYFMAYALMNARAIYEGLRETDADTRVFQLTRNGYTGLQRYNTASWSGDIGTRWEDMRSQITAGMNYSLCGNPYWTMDIGGFCVENRYSNAQNMYDRNGTVTPDLEEWRELQTRWYQFGTFTPLYRAHGPFPLREIFNIAEEGSPTYESVLKYNRLRYRMMPYIYSLAGLSYTKDYTIMRGLVMDYAKDPAVLNVADQFMMGPSLMVCPVYKYQARSREVYLPAGTKWYEFESDKAYEGGQTIVADAPYESIPLFVPAGGILVYGPEIEYVDQKPATELTVHLYTGKDGSFTLYEDDGLTYAYEKGQYTEIPFIYDDAARTLTIGERKGSYEGMIAERKIVLAVHEDGPHHEIGYEVKYNGEKIVINLK